MLIIISIMEVEFDKGFKHPWSMIVSGPSSYGKTVFTKQVLNKSDRQFESIYWFYCEWQDGYKDCSGISFVSGMPSSLDAYLELSGPKAMVFDDMMMQSANSELIAQYCTQQRHHQNLSVILILQNVYGQGKLMRNVHLNTEYVVLFRNPRGKSQVGCLARPLEPKHSKTLMDAYVDATSRPYSHILVDLKPLTPDALPYRSNYQQLDRQTVYVIGAVPT